MNTLAGLFIGVATLALVWMLWRAREGDRVFKDLYRADDFGKDQGSPWLRIIECGSVVGRSGEQPIYDWISVEDSFGVHHRLVPCEDFDAIQGALFRFDAGSVIYIQRAPIGRSRAMVDVPVDAPSRKAALQGFSLLELMAVVAIAGILASIAIHYYGLYVTESSLEAQQSAMMTAANQLAQYLQDHDTYVGGCSSLVPASNFSMQCTSTGTTSYVLEADGSGTMQGFKMTLNQDGDKATTSVPAGWVTSAACWVADPSGDCAK